MTFWSKTYEQAREQFLVRAVQIGEVFSLPIASKIDPGDELSIDIVWIGRANAKNVLLIQSGVHGVEAFAGSAIQNSFLHNLQEPKPNTAIVLVHVLNPYGMKALRRVNENNVDLNRNCVFNGFEKLKSQDSAYRKLDSVLNPRTKSRDNWFWPRMVFVLMKQGYPSLSQAVAQGQYSIADGIFYGGNCLQPEIIAYGDWIKRYLANVEHLTAIDLHTGLGKYAAQTLITESPDGVNTFERAANALSHSTKTSLLNNKDTYSASGSFSGLFANLLSQANIEFATCEYGAYASPVVLRALSEENRQFFAGKRSIDDTSFLNMFSPNDERWRRAVLDGGGELLAQLLAHTNV